MIIAGSELKNIIGSEIKIVPFKKDQITEGSIDLTLSNEFRLPNKSNKIIPIKENTDYKEYSKKVIDKSIVLGPGAMVIGITKEKIHLSENVCGWLQGRSRFARLGLAVHVTASYVQPGSNNRQVLEIINMSNNSIELFAGERIVQLVLERCEGTGKLGGKFKDQKL